MFNTVIDYYILQDGGGYHAFVKLTVKRKLLFEC